MSCGSVASYFSENGALAKFPALSWQLPGADALRAVRARVARGRAARDPRGRVGSAPVRPTRWLYQPFASGARAGVAPTPVGGSASTFIAFEDVDVPSSFVAVHVLVTPVVGPGIEIAGSHPLELVRGGLAVTVQCRTMKFPPVLPLHHPLLPAIPSIEDEMEGVAAAARPGVVAATSETTQRTTSGLSASRIVLSRRNDEAGAADPVVLRERPAADACPGVPAVLPGLEAVAVTRPLPGRGKRQLPARGHAARIRFEPRNSWTW